MNRQEMQQLQFIEMEISMLEEQIRNVMKEEKVCRLLIDEKKKDELNKIIADYQQMIIKNLENLYYKRNLIEKYIESVEDSELRIILRMRFIKIYSWQKIACEIGKTDESTPRKRVEKFFSQK